MKRWAVYLRGILVLLVAGAIGLVLFQNRSYKVNLWFFGLTDASKQVNVVWVMVWTAGFTRAAWWLFSFGRGLIRDVRELRRNNALVATEQAYAKRAAELDERERLIEERKRRSETTNDE